MGKNWWKEIWEVGCWHNKEGKNTRTYSASLQSLRPFHLTHSIVQYSSSTQPQLHLRADLFIPLRSVFSLLEECVLLPCSKILQRNRTNRIWSYVMQAFLSQFLVLGKFPLLFPRQLWCSSPIFSIPQRNLGNTTLFSSSSGGQKSKIHFTEAKSRCWQVFCFCCCLIVFCHLWLPVLVGLCLLPPLPKLIISILVLSSHHLLLTLNSSFPRQGTVHPPLPGSCQRFPSTSGRQPGKRRALDIH